MQPSAPPFHTEEKLWHTLAIERVLSLLDTHPKHGLTQAEAARRLAVFGMNQLTEGHRTSAWEILLAQCKNFFVIILLIAVGLSALLGHGVEAIAIGVIVLLAVLLGFAQEYRAERAIDALKKMAAPLASVLRDGEEVEIDAEKLVPGDVIILSTGDHLPADGRLLESMSLQINEAVLTGESMPVEKHTAPIENPTLSIGDRKNMVYSGTMTTYGRGRAVITATGMRTEFGTIAGVLQFVKREQTPLQKNLDRFGKSLTKVTLAVVIIIGGVGYLRGQPLLDMLIFAIALAVAVVPEALPAVVTISLAIGAQRMVKRHALVRRLSAVETLGSTSIICSDKTGTLTKDEMTVRKIFVAGKMIEVTGAGYEPKGEFIEDGKSVMPSAALLELLQGALLASDTRLIHHAEDGWDIKGDPTEGALVVAATKAKLQRDLLDEKYPRTGEIPFTSETKRMTTLHATSEGDFAYSKGAPEIILASSTRQKTALGDTPMNAKEREAILAAAHIMATGALRVIAVAKRTDATLENAERDMTFLGLFGMIDPPRPEAKIAVQQCRDAGIKVVMITGDHPITAQAVARELGILDGGRAVTGAQLDEMSDSEFDASVEHIDVYARVSPTHKLKVIMALQKKGHIVAMTGDGVNDAPALKKADIGIAMGITGTDVSKEAAAMTLMDDNFSSIVAAVEEGRGIFDNIKKYLMYLLPSNIGQICLIVGASILGLPLPLSTIQILYVNLATDGLPALALAVDPPERDLMRRSPRHPSAGIFTRPAFALMLTGGIWLTIINLTLFWWVLQSGRSLSTAMTMVFVTIICTKFYGAFCFRSDRRSVLSRPFANRWLNLAIIWEILLVLIVLHVPFLQHLFGVVSLQMESWLMIIVLSATIIPVLEFVKYLARRNCFGSMC